MRYSAAAGSPPSMMYTVLPMFAVMAVILFMSNRRQKKEQEARKSMKKGERVATLCWNHHAHLEAYFGIPAAGGVMHTLNLRLSPEDIGWIAGHAQNRFLIVDDVLLPLYQQFAHLHRFEEVIVFPYSGQSVAQGFTDYEAMLAGADPDGFRYAPHDENDPVAMCYTSGTTGRPKGVVYSHRSTVLHTLVASLGDFWGLRGTDRVLPVTPMFHANSWGMPYGAVMMGVKLIFPGPHLHPDDLLDLMREQPPTLALGVPTIWLSLIQAYADKGFEVHQVYGLTESGGPGCLLLGADALQRAGSTGRGFFHTEARVVGLDGSECRRGDPGEVQLRGPNLMVGYWNRPDATAQAFTRDGWLRTGDVGTMDDEGFVTLRDRLKDMLISGGENVYPAEVENMLLSHPQIADAAVLGLPSPKWGEVPLAVLVKKPGAALTEADLLGWCKGKLASFKLPKVVVFAEAIPRNPSGKILKRVLREQLLETVRAPE